MSPPSKHQPPRLLFSARRIFFATGLILVTLLLIATPFVGTPDGEKSLAFMRITRRLSFLEFYAITTAVYATLFCFLAAFVAQFFIWNHEYKSER